MTRFDKGVYFCHIFKINNQIKAILTLQLVSGNLGGFCSSFSRSHIASMTSLRGVLLSTNSSKFTAYNIWLYWSVLCLDTNWWESGYTGRISGTKIFLILYSKINASHSTALNEIFSCVWKQYTIYMANTNVVAIMFWYMFHYCPKHAKLKSKENIKLYSQQ